MTSNVTLSVEFPLVDKFPGFLDLDIHAAMLSELFGRKIHGEEVGVCENELYWGVFYLGDKPTKVEIQSMLNAAGYVVEDDVWDGTHV